MLRNNSRLSASSRRPEDVKLLKSGVVRDLTIYDGNLNGVVVDQSIGTWNYSFSLFCINKYFVSKDVAIDVTVVDRNGPFLQNEDSVWILLGLKIIKK